jgi:hypothetical protein
MLWASATREKEMAQRANVLRVDVLPELYPYRDDGCEAAPRCLHCPLARCKYDDPGGLQREQRERRDSEVLLVYASERLTVPQLARRFAVSQRTVFRILGRRDFPAPTSHSRGTPPM